MQVRPTNIDDLSMPRVEITGNIIDLWIMDQNSGKRYWITMTPTERDRLIDLLCKGVVE